MDALDGNSLKSEMDLGEVISSNPRASTSMFILILENFPAALCYVLRHTGVGAPYDLLILQHDSTAKNDTKSRHQWVQEVSKVTRPDLDIASPGKTSAF